MRRILIAVCKQKVSTFNPHLSQYADFRFRYGQDLLNYQRSVRLMLECELRCAVWPALSAAQTAASALRAVSNGQTIAT